MGSMLEITDIQKCNYTMVVETLLYEGPISRMDLSVLQDSTRDNLKHYSGFY